MHFLLEHHHIGMALPLRLWDHALKSFHHVYKLIVCQSALLLSLRLLLMKLRKMITLTLWIVSKNDRVKMIFLGSDSHLDLFDLFLGEKSFLFVRFADLVLDLEDGSIYLQE